MYMIGLFETHSRRFVLFQAEDGIRDLVRSRGLGDVYKRQVEEEKAADRFAGAFLMARDMIVRLLGSNRTSISLLSLIHI